ADALEDQGAQLEQEGAGARGLGVWAAAERVADVDAQAVADGGDVEDRRHAALEAAGGRGELAREGGVGAGAAEAGLDPAGEAGAIAEPRERGVEEALGAARA